MSSFFRPSPLAVSILGVLCLASSACSSRPAPVAYDNRVFYEYDAAGGQDLGQLLEAPVAELDGELAQQPFIGVEILGGVARYSRPADWVIRRGSVRPEARFIEYVSPRQVVISVYERLESPRDTWTSILGRYESETEKQGGTLLGKGVPLATYDSQARAYDVRRGIPAGSEPFVSYSREYVVRSDHRIVLVQIVRPRDDFGEAAPQLRKFVQSIRVL